MSFSTFRQLSRILSSSSRVQRDFNVPNAIYRSQLYGRRGLHMTSPRAALYKNPDSKTFEQVTGEKGRVVLVDFYADWCGPCRTLSPVIERLTLEPNTSGSGLPLDLVKIDTESAYGQVLGREYQVSALPTILAFKDGKVVNGFRGALPEPKIKEFLSIL